MRTYLIRNTVSKDEAWTDAEDFQTACENLSWLRMDCLVVSSTVNKNGDKVITDQKNYPKTIKFRYDNKHRFGGGHSIKAIYFGKHGITIETESAYDQLAKQDRVREQAKDMPRDHRGRFTDGFHKIKLPNTWGKVRVDKNGEKLIF